MVRSIAEAFSFYDFLWFFAIYAFFGWCTEVAYAAMCDGRFVNRGFLNGPACPIYGFGVILVLGLLTPLKGSIPALFAGAVVLTSVLEWLTGFALEKVFHDKWWDYSDMPFNISGYICLKFSVLWGLACILIVDIVHPFVETVVGFIPLLAGKVLITVILLLFFADAAVTVAAILKLNRRIAVIHDIADKLSEAANLVGENISEEVLEIESKRTEFIERAASFKEQAENLADAAEQFKVNKTEELAERIRNLAEKKELLRARCEEFAVHGAFIRNRLLKAFPNLSYDKFRPDLEQIWKSALAGLKGADKRPDEERRS